MPAAWFWLLLWSRSISLSPLVKYERHFVNCNSKLRLSNNRSWPQLVVIRTESEQYSQKKGNSYNLDDIQLFLIFSLAKDIISIVLVASASIRSIHPMTLRNDKSMRDRLLVIWTKEEDDILRDQVKLHGIDKWAKISTHLCGKTSRQCRRRWHMFLNVVNKRGGWTADEDKLLLEVMRCVSCQAHQKFGNRWTEIAKKLPGRTDNAVKNRFCVLCKKQTKEVEVSPLQRPIDSVTDIAKQKLSERRILEGQKALLDSGANKKIRTEANRSRKPEVVLQQRDLEETLQQWKALRSSEILTSSPHQASREGSSRPWVGSVESNVLQHRNTKEERLQGWMGLAIEGTASAAHQQMQMRQDFQRWEASQSGTSINDPICSTSSLPGETQTLKVLQSHIPSISPSSHSRLMQENLQRWKRANIGEVSGNSLHHQKMLKTSHSTWSTTKTADSSNNLRLQQRPDNELRQWWKGVDKTMISNVALQKREVDEALVHWEQNSQDSVTASFNHWRSVDENLPPLSEMNSLGAVYMSNFKQCTLVSGMMQRWSTVQYEKPSAHVQQSRAGETQTWDHSVTKEANDGASNIRSEDDMHEWQDWNTNKVNNYTASQDRPVEHTMEIDDKKPDFSSESVFFETSVKRLPMWTSPNCQQANVSTVLHKREGLQAQQWNKNETQTTSPRQLLEQKLQRWDKSETAVHSSPLTSILSHFEDCDSKSTTHLLGVHSERQAGQKSQLIDESGKTAIEKMKCVRTAITADTETQTPTKDGEDGKLNTEEGLPSENSTTCETSIDVCGEPHDEVQLVKIDEEASQMTESPTLDIRSDVAHSPTQIVPRSNLTMECMPSPQFSDSEKEFLLSTLAVDQTTTNCWSSSPLRPPSRFNKVRNPLIDIRYDTPARSPLSSCLLRQFQISDA